MRRKIPLSLPVPGRFLQQKERKDAKRDDKPLEMSEIVFLCVKKRDAPLRPHMLKN